MCTKTKTPIEKRNRIVRFLKSFEKKKQYQQPMLKIALMIVMWSGSVYLYSYSLHNLSNSWMPIVKFIVAFFLVACRALCFDPMHDFGHKSSLPTEIENKVCFWFISPMYFMTWSHWTYEHNKHHKHSNNNNSIEGYDTMQTANWTLKRFKKASSWLQVLYTIRHGILLGGFFSFYDFVLQSLISCVTHPILNLPYTLWFIAYYAFQYNISPDLMYLDMYTLVFTWQLIWIFAIHGTHTFEGGYRAEGGDWTFVDSGLYGAASVTLPQPLKTFVGEAGMYHSIHHINARIPSYNLRDASEKSKLEIFKDNNGNEEELFPPVNLVYLSELMISLTFMVYDEDNDKFIGLVDVVKAMSTANAAGKTDTKKLLLRRDSGTTLHKEE
ncbi:fatty acid desaturase-domain-containing protein [Globomyces pollinis-pini]|nr:fatty acid desaturase-domain-containing protein [Globomyces pollinis-pini]